MTPETNAVKTRTVRFQRYGEPADVLQMDEALLPPPHANRVRVRVTACGLNPADWALCRGLFPGSLPRGIGLDVSGVADAVGEGVQDVAVGDAVFGPADFAGSASAGAADFAILSHWARTPANLDPVHAAALPMAVVTAYGSLGCLGIHPGDTVVINGAGTMMGFAAVQMALMDGASVVAIAGQNFADQLGKFGATVVPYGDGVVEGVRRVTGKSPVLILDTAPVSGALPALVEIAGDPQRVLTISDFAAAKELGARTNLGEMKGIPYDVMGKFALLAEEGKFAVPIARTFSLAEWRTAMEISLSKRAHGKLMLLP